MGDVDWGWEGIKKNPDGFGYIRVLTENGTIDDAKVEENTLVEIRLTPSLHRFRMYLNEWLAGEPVEESEIEELKMLMAPEERESFLLVLSAFLAGEDVTGAILLDRKVETYSNKIQDKELYSKIVDALELITLEKEPDEEEDTIGDSKDLPEFCEKIKDLGEERESYKREWIEKLLSFSVEEILGITEGNKVVEKLLIGADSDLVVEFIKKIRDVQKLTEPEKVLIRKVITQQPRCQKEETGKFIQEWFADGINKKLLLDPQDLISDLKNISLKFCTIESLKDPQMVAQYEMQVVHMCLQDPTASLYQLMSKSVSVEVFRVLSFARPFYHLHFISKKELKENEISLQSLPSALIVHCFSKLLKFIPDYPDSCYDALDKAICKFLQESILNPGDIYAVLKYRILKYLGANNQVPLSLVQGYVVLIESLVKQKNHLSDENLISEIIQFVVNINRLICLFTNSTTINYAPQIREKFRVILDHLEVPFGQVTKAMEENVEDCSIFDQGILYVRFNELRPIIKNFIVGKNISPNLMSFNEFLSVCALPWVLNCTEMEWGPLAEFLFDVIMSPDSNLIGVKHLGKIKLLNEMLVFMYSCCVDQGSLQPFSHVQGFYVKAVDKLGLKDENEWHDLFRDLLMIGAEMSRSSKRDRKKKGHGKDDGGSGEEKKDGLDQNEKGVSLYILLSYLTTKLDDFEKSGNSLQSYEGLRSELKRFHEVNANCEPLRWLVSEKLEKLENKVGEA